jgi:hypothetical protein
MQKLSKAGQAVLLGNSHAAMRSGACACGREPMSRRSDRSFRRSHE